ncbi:MAG: hypothetical protein RI637_01365 [Acidimicrobiia bacterium]|nr:hypothetical protein [Acidimicrobiia bacterium]
MFAIRSLVVVTLLFVLAACATTGEPGATAPTITIPIATTSTTAPATTVSTVPALEPCDPPGFLPSALPERVIDDRPDVSAVPLDELTLQAGTIVTGWTDAAGNPVLAMVRGALPPTRWIDTPEEIAIRGVKAAVGELGDGIWAVAWFEGPDRCDEYYLVFYPPTGPEEARAVAESLTGSG